MTPRAHVAFSVAMSVVVLVAVVWGVLLVGSPATARLQRCLALGEQTCIVQCHRHLIGHRLENGDGVLIKCVRLRILNRERA